MLRKARKFEEEQTVEDIGVPKKVGLVLYWKYLKSGGNCCHIFILILFSFIAQILYTGSDYTLEILISAEEYLIEYNHTHYASKFQYSSLVL